MGAFLTTTIAEEVRLQAKMLEKLEENCAKCKILQGKKHDSTFILSAHEIGDNTVKTRTSMVAIAVYGAIHAVQESEAFDEFKEPVFEYLLRRLEKKDTIVVFSQRAYDAIKRVNWKNLKVKLYLQ